jgi:exodeoxyribonuclease VII large subunit
VTALARHVRDPRRTLVLQRQRVVELNERARRGLAAALRAARLRLAADAERLHALSPLAVLERGYTIARREDGAVVRSAQEVEVGEALDLTFRAGGARVRIESRRS